MNKSEKSMYEELARLLNREIVKAAVNLLDSGAIDDCLEYPEVMELEHLVSSRVSRCNECKVVDFGVPGDRHMRNSSDCAGRWVEIDVA